MFQSLKDRLDRTDIDFLKYRKFTWWVSLGLVLLSWVLFAFGTPNWGIDFTGGTEIQVQFEEPIEIDEIRTALGRLEIPNDAVQSVGGEGEHAFKIRIKDPEFGATELKKTMTEALKAEMGEGWVADWDQDVRFSSEVGARFSVRYTGERVTPDQLTPVVQGVVPGAKVDEGREENELVIKLPGLASQIEKEIGSVVEGRAFKVLSVDAVGPRVGESLRQQGLIAMLATLALVMVYVAFRFELAFAPGAILALVHDVSMTALVFWLFNREINLTFIGAELTILGYSINDTIVIYDRIREIRPQFRKDELERLINVSLNSTLTRTLTTSGATMLAVLPFLFLGTEVIRDFALAMTVGMIFGVYSTVYIATPMIIVTEKLRPWLEGLIAIDVGGDEEGADVPDAFLSESEKRRRERAKLEQGTDEP